jgi:hypothetical protein
MREKLKNLTDSFNDSEVLDTISDAGVSEDQLNKFVMACNNYKPMILEKIKNKMFRKWTKII